MSKLFALSAVALLALSVFATSAYAEGKSGRSKTIDFDGDVVEGMNKRPLDSLNQISEAERRRMRPHLYQKRKGFRTETQDSVRELRYIQ
jgi:hypothetical protein